MIGTIIATGIFTLAGLAIVVFIVTGLIKDGPKKPCIYCKGTGKWQDEHTCTVCHGEGKI